ENHPRRRVRVHRAPHAGAELVQAEVAELTILLRKRKIWIPAQSDVDGEPGVHRPCVLHVAADVVARLAQEILHSLLERVGLADEKVCEAQSCVLVRERVYSGGIDVGIRIERGADVVDAHPDLMRSPEEAQVLNELL